MITDVKVSVSAANKEGDIVCNLKFKAGQHSPDLDQWLDFFRNHLDKYNLVVSIDGIQLCKPDPMPLPDGQTTLEVVDDDASEDKGPEDSDEEAGE